MQKSGVLFVLEGYCFHPGLGCRVGVLNVQKVMTPSLYDSIPFLAQESRYAVCPTAPSTVYSVSSYLWSHILVLTHGSYTTAGKPDHEKKLRIEQSKAADPGQLCWTWVVRKSQSLNRGRREQFC